MNPASLVAVKSRIPSRYFAFSRIPHRILVKSRIPRIPFQTLIEPFDAMCLGSRISQLFFVSSGCVVFRSFVFFKEIIPVVSEGGINKLRIKFSHPLQLVKRPRLSCDVMQWFERSSQGLKGSHVSGVIQAQAPLV